MENYYVWETTHLRAEECIAQTVAEMETENWEEDEGIADERACYQSV